MASRPTAARGAAGCGSMAKLAAPLARGTAAQQRVACGGGGRSLGARRWRSDAANAASAARPRPLLARAADGAAAGGAEGAPASAVVNQRLRVELATPGARGSLRFDVAPMGSGQAIVCVDVAPGSEAEEEGVRPGMRLTAISDPIRRDEVWKLQDRPSLKNIRELLRMRSSDTITLEFEPWDGPMPGAALESGVLRTASGGGSAAGSSAAGSTLSSLDSITSSQDGSGGGGDAVAGESIGERLARQYQEAAAGGRAQTAVEARQQRRKAALELNSQRDDRPLLLGLFLTFALPPLVILLVAKSSGFLDALYTNTLSAGRLG